MASQQHMYRRGAVYWWRRVLDLSPSVRYDMRISLRTTIKTEARQRAGFLTALAGSSYDMSSATDDNSYQVSLSVTHGPIGAAQWTLFATAGR